MPLYVYHCQHHELWTTNPDFGNEEWPYQHPGEDDEICDPQVEKIEFEEIKEALELELNSQ